jgi:hypothetical protein
MTTSSLLTLMGPTRQVTDPQFERFWSVWPRERRVAKRTALLAFRRAIKRSSVDDIIEGAERYARERDGQDHRFTKHPSTWLNGDCWEDSPQERAGNGTFMDIEEEIRGH